MVAVRRASPPHLAAPFVISGAPPTPSVRGQGAAGGSSSYERSLMNRPSERSIAEDLFGGNASLPRWCDPCQTGLDARSLGDTWGERPNPRAAGQASAVAPALHPREAERRHPWQWRETASQKVRLAEHTRPGARRVR